MTAAATRVFVARMSGLAVFDPMGDQVGRVRDVVVTIRPDRQLPPVVGMVVEVPGRRRVFVPMTRVTSMGAGQVITNGLVNLRRFEQRPAETLVIGELLDRVVSLRGEAGDAGPVSVEDVAIERTAREWQLTRAFVRRVPAGRSHHTGVLRPAGRLRRRRRGQAFQVGIEQLADLGDPGRAQAADTMLATLEELKAADLAGVINALGPKRRLEVASALDDERLADVLEELPEQDQVAILGQLATDRAADVLEAMQPDDAADLVAELPAEQAELLLRLMRPEEAADLRRLMAYDDDTAGGLMTPQPVVLPPEAAIAEALARVRRVELSPSLAAAVFVCRPPLEVPTGRFLGMVHIQRMLREPPHQPIGAIIDRDVRPLTTDAPLKQVARQLAIYNLVSVPVADSLGRLVGAVTVDDVLDHLLPPHWRDPIGESSDAD